MSIQVTRVTDPKLEVLPIHAQLQKQIITATRDHRLEPRDLRVSFSEEGYMRAWSQTVPGFNPWDGQNQPKHYMGLPFVTDRTQAVDVLLQLSDGGAIEGRS